MTEVSDAYGFFRGRMVLDRDGDKIGRIDDVYEDKQTGRPEWALVNTGLFGTKKTFVPLQDAAPVGEDVRVPLEKGHVKDAPSIEADGELSESEERQLYPHYDVAYDADGDYDVVTEEEQRTVPVRREEVRVEREPITDANVDQAMTGPEISDEEHEVVLHEEEVVTEKRAVPKERVRLDKETVVEEQQVSEEVRKEQIEADGDTGSLDR